MKKMLLVCSFLVVFLGFGFVAQANEPEYVTNVRAYVDNANARIEALVVVAQNEALYLEQTTPIEQYNAELKILVDNLVNETNAIAFDAIAYAESYGVFVECEYVKYEIGTKNVKIDPIVVIGWEPETPNP